MRTFADGQPARRTAPPIDELRQRRDEILEICRRHGASNVRVFGSLAKGLQGADSDVDFLVDFRADVSLFTWARLIQELEGMLGCPVDVVELASLKERMRDEVSAEAVRL